MPKCARRGQVDLVRLHPEPRNTRVRDLTIAGGVLCGVAAPTLVAGRVLLTLDGKPYCGRSNGEDVDPQGDCRFRFASNVHGGVLVGLAAALAIGGIVLLTQARRPARAAATRAAVRGGVLEVRW